MLTGQNWHLMVLKRLELFINPNVGKEKEPETWIKSWDWYFDQPCLYNKNKITIRIFTLVTLLGWTHGCPEGRNVGRNDLTGMSPPAPTLTQGLIFPRCPFHCLSLIQLYLNYYGKYEFYDQITNLEKKESPMLKIIRSPNVSNIWTGDSLILRTVCPKYAGLW